MALAHEVDLVIEHTPLSELDDVVSRVVRDLHLTSALCTSETVGLRRLLAWAGGDPLPFLRSIRAIPAPRYGRCNQVPSTSGLMPAAGIGAYVAAPISIDDGPVAGVLWAAAPVRRWFDHDEMHHLQLLARRAAGLLRQHLVIGLDDRLVSVPEPVLSLS